MSMGKRIRQARKHKGFTQEFVAEALGISRQAVFKWEKDQAKPDTKNMIALSELLGVSAEYLINGKSDRRLDSASNMGEGFFMASLIPLLLLPVCWLIGVFSGEYTDMVQIPVSDGIRLGIPFLMYGHSPVAIILTAVSIVSLILVVLLLVLGANANKK